MKISNKIAVPAVTLAGILTSWFAFKPENKNSTEIKPVPLEAPAAKPRTAPNLESPSLSEQEITSIKDKLSIIISENIFIAQHNDIARSVGHNQFAQHDELSRISINLLIKDLGDFAATRGWLNDKDHQFNLEFHHDTSRLTTNVVFYNLIIQEIEREQAKAAGQNTGQPTR